MTAPKPSQFGEFFETLHKRAPFRWQQMLFDDVISGPWPDLIDLPTAHGKTACIDVAVFALACTASAKILTPRRIWFVVDRRIVVDEAYERAEKIANKLRTARSGILRHVADALRALGGTEEAPLQVGRLRGGAPRKIAWAGNPAQPVVITSTVDQIGSRLLFRGYGLGDGSLPMHAALAGNDSLILLDEAHLARPFYQTVSAVERLRDMSARESVATPLKLVVMSATPASEDGPPPRRFPKPERRTEALAGEVLEKRRAARKETELALAKRPKLPGEWKPATKDELVLDAAFRAVGLVASGRRRMAVMVNRVRTAREIAAELRGAPDHEKYDVVLITGRLRPVDRDALIDAWSPVLKSGSEKEPEKPVIFVTTQCLEVGADFSFDALITECASLDALRQRFGRLARLGEPADAPGVILIRKDDATAKEPDPVYGDAMKATWQWLTAGGRATISMGIDALEPLLPDAEELKKLRAPQRCAPTLLPAYLDILSQTGPRPPVEPDIALFLHGVPPPERQTAADVRVLWRRELDTPNDDGLWKKSIEAMPPLSAESLTLPVWELRKALADDAAQMMPEEASDLTGTLEPPEPAAGRKAATSMRASEPFLISRGQTVLDPGYDLTEIRAGDAVVLKASSIAPSPAFTRLVDAAPGGQADVYERAYLSTHGVARVRVSVTAEKAESEDFDDHIEKGVRESLKVLLSSALVSADAKESISATQHGGSHTPNDGPIPVFERPRRVEYATNHYHLTGWQQLEPVDRWLAEATDADANQEGADSRRGSSLADHTADVVRHVDFLHAALGRTGLSDAFAAAVRLAAERHDWGKADPRFQHVLHRRPRATALRAKSDPPSLPPARERELRLVAGLPDGFRHEMLSVQMAHGDSELAACAERDLVLHLIASHHGQARPFAPLTLDPNPPDVSTTIGERTLSISTDDRKLVPPHRLDSGIAERFWELTRRFGWWGLAYLETILRAADRQASTIADQEASG